MPRHRSRRTAHATFILLIVLAIAGAAAGPRVAAQETTLRIVGFEVVPEEEDTPLDQAYEKFLADFQAANPEVEIESLETPPEFDTQLLVDLAAGTAPDVWQQDASTIARLIDGEYVLDMRECQTLVPELTFDRFVPNVLAIHQRPDGAVFGLPNDFTPMVVYYNPQSFERAGVTPPTADWTWDDLLQISQELTLDDQGRNRLDPEFDEENVAQWGFRVRQFAFEWIYRVWANGGDVIAPDGSTVSGYLDSPQTIETLQFLQDLVLVHKVSPEPTALDQMTQSVAFNDRFLTGEFAMFDRGHWELVGLRNSPEYSPEAVDVVGQPAKQSKATVIYASGWVIRADLEGEKLEAACKLVNAATDRAYQDTKAITGIAIAANQASAEAAIASSENPELEEKFLAEAANGRPPHGATFPGWLAIEVRLDSMMERILAGGDVEEEVANAVTEINRELEGS